MRRGAWPRGEVLDTTPRQRLLRPSARASPLCPPSPSATIMLGIFMVAALSLAGPPLIVKLRAVCSELDVASTGLSVAEATTLATQAIGMEVEGSTLSEQVDFLATQLGITFEVSDSQPAPPRKPPQRPSHLPAMVVFDLDFTLWRPELYQLSSGPPFTVSSDGCVITRRGERMELFPAARKSLRELADNNVPIAIASRAGEVEWAEEIMRLMRVDEKRTMADVIGEAPVVIQGGSKTRHLKHIAHLSGVALRDMLFFDNERTNIQEVDKLGVTCVHCPRGMTDDVFRDGIALHQQRVSEARSAKGGSSKSRRDEDDDERPRAKAKKKERRKGGRGR